MGTDQKARWTRGSLNSQKRVPGTRGRAEGAGGKWQYLGVIGLFDPPRDDSAATIKEAKDLGIDVKMVTGDNIAIAGRSRGRWALGPTSSRSRRSSEGRGRMR